VQLCFARSGNRPAQITPRCAATGRESTTSPTPL
jgi:hypothetical protein